MTAIRLRGTLLALLLAVCCVTPPPAHAAAFDRARIAELADTPTLLVDGRPFFFVAGAFFYPRIPPESWAADMLAMRRLGANTLDLYIPWNWHEPADGAFDFDGHTNPRRNLREVLRLARALGFHLIVRPGPVIRNEWRNGGYPAWLLTRPAYHMPLHDVLEGRYAATATLQNAHSDDAAAQWLANPTHLRYAARWLHRVLLELRPYADLVLAIQLDDDQGAYADNQTWPAPHLQRYLRWLDAQVRAVAGDTIPTFINTYEMKVPASAPVWAMGNWYGTADELGDHDRTELDYALATLTTQQHVPLALSEFQAGWLAAPEDPRPRPSDPNNTALALAEALAWGAHGVVFFPLQDTLAPFGWEAPFSNAFYAWDAALPRDPALAARVPARQAPVAAFGTALQRWGAALAGTHRFARIAVVYGPSAIDERNATQAALDAIAAQFKDALHACIARGLVCDAVDLRYASAQRLHAYRTLVLPPLGRPMLPSLAVRLARLRAAGVRVTASVPDVRGNGIVPLVGPAQSFGVVSNWTYAPLRVGGRVDLGPHRSVTVAPFVLAPRSAELLVLGASAQAALSLSGRPAPQPTSLPTGAWTALAAGARVRLEALRPRGSAGAIAYRTDAFGRGDPTIVLENARLRAIVVPNGGARLVVLQRIDVPGGPLDATNATGALRDDVLIQPPPSTTDRIAAYTHTYPAGTFNRPYRAEILAARGDAVSVRFSYAAPDVVPHGARFEKTLTLAAGAPRLVVDERVTFPGDGAARQRAVTHDALALPPPAAPTAIDDGVVGWNGSTAIAVLWGRGTVERTTWTPYASNGTLTLIRSAGSFRTVYAVAPARTSGEATAFAQAERDWLAAHPKPSARP